METVYKGPTNRDDSDRAAGIRAIKDLFKRDKKGSTVSRQASVAKFSSVIGPSSEGQQNQSVSIGGRVINVVGLGEANGTRMNARPTELIARYF